MSEEDRATQEAAAVRAEYARRDSDTALAHYYARITPALERAHRRRREQLLHELNGLRGVELPRVIDVGTASGADLAFLSEHGFDRARLVGVDLRAEVIAAGPRVGLLAAADAARLPFRDGSFDVALQTTLLSSVLDPAVRASIANELARVTRAGGLVLSFDIRNVRRSDRRLTPIDSREIARLFAPHGDVTTVSKLLDLRIASRVPGPIAALLERVPFLRTHELAIVRRRDMAVAHESIAATYDAYGRGRASLWSGREAGARIAATERDDWLARALAPVGTGTALDLGCGDANLARTLAARGTAIRYFGVDLLADRLRDARALTGRAAIAQASAAQLPFADRAMDAVVASTLLSSLLAPWLRAKVAGEVARVLRPGGRLVVYDLRYPSPGNPHVRPVTTGELRMLFPGWRLIEARTLTVLPPLARSALSSGPRRYGILSRVPLLRSHLGVILERPA